MVAIKRIGKAGIPTCSRRRPSSSPRDGDRRGEGKILTAGGIDSHIHFICPQQVDEAIAAGMTTLIGGWHRPGDRTSATTCTPGPWHLARIIQAAEGLPVNLGFAARATRPRPQALEEMNPGRRLMPEAARGLGHNAAAIDNCLSVADRFDVTVMITRHAERIRVFVEDTIAAFKGPHHPCLPHRGRRRRPRADIIKVAGLANVLPSHTNRRGLIPPTRWTSSRLLMAVIIWTATIPRTSLSGKPYPQETIAAEDILHASVPLSMMSSTARRWAGSRGDHPHLANGAQDEAATRLPARDKRGNDNARAKRYVAKYTSTGDRAGLRARDRFGRGGKLADLVLCRNAFFRRQAGPGDQGRHDRLRADGRSQCFDPDAAAGALSADVRGYGGALAETCLTSCPRGVGFRSGHETKT